MRRSCTFSRVSCWAQEKTVGRTWSPGRPRPCVGSPPSTPRLFSELNLRKDEGVGSASVLRCRVPGITRNPGSAGDSAQGKPRFGGQFNVVARSSCTTSGHHTATSLLPMHISRMSITVNINHGRSSCHSHRADALAALAKLHCTVTAVCTVHSLLLLLQTVTPFQSRIVLLVSYRVALERHPAAPLASPGPPLSPSPATR